MNFFPGRLVGLEDAGAVVDAGAIGRLTVQHDTGTSGARVGDAVVVAVRPEKISFADDPGQAGNRLAGDLVAASYLGDRNHLFVRVDGVARPVAVASQNVTPQTGQAPRSGGVCLEWRPESAILLPEHGAWAA